MRSTGRLIAVAGCRGGAGASSLAAAIARAVHRQTERSGRFGNRGTPGGNRCVLIDLCDGGAGLEVLLGIESEPGARWPEMEAARGEVDGSELLLALPQWLGVPVLSVSRHHPKPLQDEVVLDVCAGLLRDGAVLLLDVPAPSAWTPAIRALISDADQSLIATVDTAFGLAGAVAVGFAFEQLHDSTHIANAGGSGNMGGGSHRRHQPRPDCGLVLRARRGSRVGDSEVEKLVGLPVLARFRDDRHLATAIELGAGPITKSTKRLTKVGAVLAAEVMS